MDADRPQSGGAGESGGTPGSLSMFRAVAVLAVFVVAVVLLVAVGTRPSVSSPPATAPTTTTSTPPTTAAGSSSTTTTTKAGHHGSSATTTTTAPRSSVSVVVANATNTNGLAAHYSSVIGAQGWNMLTPVDASTSESVSAVYYAAGEQQAAQSVASSIGINSSQVLPLTTSVPVSGVTGTDVVVVIGEDLASTSTTTPASS